MSRNFDNLGEFAAFFQKAVSEARVLEARNVALEAAAQMIEDEAKHVIGTYEFDWPQLADATQADRARKGFAPNEPLLRTGALRDSISHEITVPGTEAIVGSTSDIAVYQELGTEHIPPRPFLLPSAIYLEKPIEEMIGTVVGSAIAGASISGEIARLAIDAARDIARTGRDLVNNDETANDK